MDPKTGLYSKAAKLIRALPQERGTAEQMIAAARKAGLKQAELEHAQPPSGPITREELAQHFEQNLPKLRVSQYGENPDFRTDAERRRSIELQQRDILSRRSRDPQPPLSPEEQAEYQSLRARSPSAVDTVMEGYDDEENPADIQYGGYTTEGGANYRERLLQLERGHNQPKYQSSHWKDHSNVLAHIRLMDRQVGEDKALSARLRLKLADHYGLGITELASGIVDRGVKDGVITPEEAASLSRVERWRSGYENKKGLDKRLLHVEELQSDWAQEGRDQGFNTGEARKAYDDHVEDMRARMRQDLLDQGLPERVAKPLYESAKPWELSKYHGEADTAKLSALDEAAIAEASGKMPPTAPYVQNTQHWTDLALKNVLREAALGNYDGIVFTPGQAQADRYSLDKHVHSLSLKRPQDGSSFGRLTAMSRIGTPLFDDQITDEKHLHSLIGRETAEKLLGSQGVVNTNEQSVNHYISGDGLKMGGQGMRGYYDGIVPKSVMRLAQQHDPDIRPADPMPLKQDGEDYQGFHLPMTDKLRQGILNEGYPAFRRGGRVDAALEITRRFTKNGKGATLRLGVKE